MQDNHDPTLPSANSAFTRPRRRVRADIPASRGLCRRLVFDDVALNDVSSARSDEDDVSSALSEVVQEEQVTFIGRWRNNRTAKDRHDSITSEVTPNSVLPSDWVPIPLSADEAPSILRRFRTSERNLERRPESPVPFLKLSPGTVGPLQGTTSPTPNNTPPRSSPSSDPLFLPRSLSDIPIRSRSFLNDPDEDLESASCSKSSGNLRDCLTPPRSPQSNDNNDPTSSTNLRRVKITGIQIH